MCPESIFSDLEIGLHLWEQDTYTLELRYTPPGSDTDERVVRRGSQGVRLDLAKLLPMEYDDVTYGRQLTSVLFRDDPEVRSVFDRARAAKLPDGEDAALRLRLFIGPNADELHAVHWETLRDPSLDAPLLTGDRVFFSRYLSSRAWEPSPLRRKGDLRVLVVIANPSDLSDYGMTEVDVPGELSRIRQAIDGLELVALASGGAATLGNLVENLREGFDIVYLVCHGELVDGQPWLWLERVEEADGATTQAGSPHVVSHRVRGNELVTQLAELRKYPRLIVLASCQSASHGASLDKGALSALGPLLAEAGIPAVVAMQGNVTMETVAEFMPRFFQELIQYGEVDRAMSVARSAVRERPDWWVPTLYMRLKSSRVWYAPGMSDPKGGLQKWAALLNSISSYRCTPILGPGVSEVLLGAREEVARGWAERYDFPMAPEDREDLPRVAQYLAVKQQRHLAKTEWADAMRAALQGQIDASLTGLDMSKPEDRDLYNRICAVREADATQSLDDFITSVADLRQERHPYDPHRVLAELPILVYLTVDPSTLLEKALEEAGKEPQVAFCRWRSRVEWPSSVYDIEPKYYPTEGRPLVFHLFGSLVKPEAVFQPGEYLDSLVLTEDDYFDYLIGATRNNELIPEVVRRTLVNSSLLFLGFRLDEWDFRVLFRSIIRREGWDKSTDFAHVAAQINPEECRIMEPEGARRYLEGYFGRADINLFWGNVGDFIQELRKRRPPAGGGP